MPYRKKYRKRKRRKKRKRRRSKMSIMRVPGIVVPDVTIVKLKFNTVFHQTPISPDSFLTFVGNGPFDPDFALSGGLTAGFESWMQFYNSYNVIKSTIQTKMLNLANSEFRYSLIPSTSSIQSPPIEVSEQQYGKLRICGRPGSSRSLVILNHSMNTSKIIGRNQSPGGYVGSATSNPAIGWFWQLAMAGVEVPAINLEYSLTATITYTLKLYDRVLNL